MLQYISCEQYVRYGAMYKGPRPEGAIRRAIKLKERTDVRDAIVLKYPGNTIVFPVPKEFACFTN